MKFEDLKDDWDKEMLSLTIRRIMYINKIQYPDDILKDFFDLLDAGGFKIEKKDIPLSKLTKE